MPQVSLLRRAALLALFAASATPAAAQTNVLTYHYDNFRSGWNQTETSLTTATVAGGSFGLLHTVALDEQVDAQPLLVTDVAIPGHGTHDVVYVATENDTVYGIDAESGAVLLTRSLGTAVPLQTSKKPGLCLQGGDEYGVLSTPVIDTSSGVMYLVSYTLENAAPVYRVRALDITTLADKTASVVVSASATLNDGATYPFQAAYMRQRPALLLSNGTIYAGFGSVCDNNRQYSRGWVLGWQAGSLAPLTHAELTNHRAKEARSEFLTSVWMSGYGIAADQKGNIYFTTGNTDRTGHGYNAKQNPAESVLKLSPDLSKVKDYFTPGGPNYGEPILDINDLDFSSGGVLLLPPEPGSVANLALAAGKVGVLYMLNQSALGHYVPNGPDNDVGSVLIGRCYCGPSSFTGNDGATRVVSSGGATMVVWRLQTSPTTSLIEESSSATLPTQSTNGFFTTVSSNGTVAGSAVIWAVARRDPNDIKNHSINETLVAYDASNSTTLFSSVAGTWPHPGVADVVPVVANGHVYVATYKQLAIYALTAPAGHTR